MVGRWLAGVLDGQAGELTSRYGRAVRVVGIANARDGFVYDADGLDLGSVLAAAGFPLFVMWLYGGAFLPGMIALLGAASLLVIWRHRQNISRLLGGTEARLQLRRG